jgi:L-threonylcarbamoyladenylate synthase
MDQWVFGSLIRITDDGFCKKLISQFKKPIVSTSANISESPAPCIFSEIDPQIVKSVDYVVSWRQNDRKKAQPSSIIKIGIKGEVKIIRK